MQVVKKESPCLRKLTGQANLQQDAGNKAAVQFVFKKINILAQQNWVFKWGLKQQNWLNLKNKLCGYNQSESSAQALSNLPAYSAPFSPDSLHYNLGN